LLLWLLTILLPLLHVSLLCFCLCLFSMNQQSSSTCALNSISFITESSYGERQRSCEYNTQQYVFTPQQSTFDGRHNNLILPSALSSSLVPPKGAAHSGLLAQCNIRMDPGLSI
jgi:hypothetical protein